MKTKYESTEQGAEALCQAVMRRQQRAHKARVLVAWRKERRETAEKTGLTIAQVQSLALALGKPLERTWAWSSASAKGAESTYDAVIRLLKTRKFRSDFRASLAAQVRAWVAEPAHRYPTPLSPRQLQMIGGAL